MTSEPISKIFPSPEKLSPILTSNSMTTPTKAKEKTSNPPKEKDEDLSLSKGSDILNSPSFSKYINGTITTSKKFPFMRSHNLHVQLVVLYLRNYLHYYF